jgi:AcrR family transcriptional regulator
MNKSEDMEKTEERLKSETRNRIFKIAAELFSRDGFYKVSVREICEAAGVTKPVLYYYFKDKDALLDALVAETLLISEKLKAKYFKPDANFLEILRATPLIYIEFIKDYKHFINFSSFLHVMNVPESIEKELTAEEEKTMAEIIGFFRKGQAEGYIKDDENFWELALSFFGPINFIVIHLVKRNVAIEKVADELNNWVEFWIKHHIKVDIQYGAVHE